jgi:hypothetical protein
MGLLRIQIYGVVWILRALLRGRRGVCLCRRGGGVERARPAANVHRRLRRAGMSIMELSVLARFFFVLVRSTMYLTHSCTDAAFIDTLSTSGLDVRFRIFNRKIAHSNRANRIIAPAATSPLPKPSSYCICILPLRVNPQTKVYDSPLVYISNPAINRLSVHPRNVVPFRSMGARLATRGSNYSSCRANLLNDPRRWSSGRMPALCVLCLRRGLCYLGARAKSAVYGSVQLIRGLILSG